MTDTHIDTTAIDFAVFSFDKNDAAKAQTEILAIIDALASTARSKDNETLARKYEHERKRYALSLAACAVLAEANAIKNMSNIAIYTLQKLRNVCECIAANSVAKLADNTRVFIMNAHHLAAKNKTYSNALHASALSQEVKAKGYTSLKMQRSTQVASTANSQASQQRQLFRILNAATDTRDDSVRALAIDVEHVTVKRLTALMTA